MNGIWRLRAALLVLLGTLFVHAGRYAISPPGHSHGSDTHGYFSWFTPLVFALAFVAATHLFATLRWTTRRSRQAALPRTSMLWPFITITLVLAHGAQEYVESFLVHGYFPAAASIAGSGGWVILPLSLAIAFAITLCLKVAVSFERRAQRQSIRFVPTKTPKNIKERRVWTPTSSILGRRLAGRAPPVFA